MLTRIDNAGNCTRGEEMKTTGLQWFGHSAVIATLALAGACAADAPLTSIGTKSIAAVADVTDGNRLPDLTGCEQLTAPVGSTLVLHTFGIGVQIYHWNGTSWGVA